MAEEWHSRAKAMKCPNCDGWILVGKTQSGDMAAATVMVVTPQNVTKHLGDGMYALMPGGYLLRLKGRHGVPMDAWRPGHGCGAPETAQERPVGEFRDPCPFPPPAPPGLGCQRLSRSITGCGQCGDTDPPSRPGTVPAVAQDGAGHVLMAELGAVPIERVRRGRVVWRDQRYSRQNV